eukprot:PhM_4_TR16921/c0_g1_i1/m.30003
MLTNSGKFKDRNPDMSAAGRLFGNQIDSTKSCLTQPKAPGTPDHMKKWRRSQQLEPGKTVIHPGLADVPPPQNSRFGRVNDYSDSASALLKSSKLSQFQAVVQDHLEKNYLSAKREPLGTSMKRGHVLPAIVETRDFAFGVPTNTSENAKTVIYPSALQDEIQAKDDHAKYVRTHGDFDPGEQKKRGYNWVAHSVDPTNHRFGFVPRKPVEELQTNPHMDSRYTTVVVKKKVDDFRKTNTDFLGETKKLGFTTSERLNENTTFGRSNVYDPQGVRGAIASGYDVDADDATLGKTAHKSKLRTKQLAEELKVDETRSFGVPTVRTDVSKPKVRKVTSNQNYGDDANARTLLNPNQHAPGGVGEQEFMQSVAKDDMREVALRPQYGLTPAVFEECWAKAQTYIPSGIVTFATFSRAVDALGH